MDGGCTRENLLAPENAVTLQPEDFSTYCQQLRRLYARADATLERERFGLARQLHDNFAQQLTALTLELSLLDNSFAGQEAGALSRDELRERLGSISNIVGQLIKSARKLTVELRPKVLDQFGLSAALEWLTQEFQRRTGIQCDFCSTGEEIQFDTRVRTEIFRIYEEILLNVARHAGATHVAVRIAQQQSRLTLQVQDNGRGIPDEAISSPDSLGLAEMRERALRVSGELKINGIPADGTLVVFHMSINQATAVDSSKAASQVC